MDLVGGQVPSPHAGDLSGQRQRRQSLGAVVVAPDEEDHRGQCRGGGGGRRVVALPVVAEDGREQRPRVDRIGHVGRAVGGGGAAALPNDGRGGGGEAGGGGERRCYYRQLHGACLAVVILSFFWSITSRYECSWGLLLAFLRFHPRLSRMISRQWQKRWSGRLASFPGSERYLRFLGAIPINKKVNFRVRRGTFTFFAPFTLLPARSKPSLFCMPHPAEPPAPAQGRR